MPDVYATIAQVDVRTQERLADVLAEAFRVLRPGGTLAVFDGDYATITVALREPDPLQGCIEAVTAPSTC